VIGVRATVAQVRLVRPEADLRTDLLQTPKTLFWVPVGVDSSAARLEVRREAPADGVEVVEWMHYAAADMATFEAMAEEYNRLGSELLSGSGDAYIPGVRVGDLRGVSVRGSVVSAQGYGEVDTPYGRFRVPVNGKATIAVRDLLAWAAIPWAGSVQWTLTLLQWRDLARVPVNQRVRFASSNGLVAPLFFEARPRAPVPLATYIVGLTSDKPQTIVVRGRGTRGAYDRILFEDSVRVEAGQSEFILNVLGFPVSPTFTLELQPEDGTQTVLDYIRVVP